MPKKLSGSDQTKETLTWLESRPCPEDVGKRAWNTMIRVLKPIYSQALKTSEVYFSVTTLATMTGHSHRTVQMALRLAEKHGLATPYARFVPGKREHTSNGYIVPAQALRGGAGDAPPVVQQVHDRGAGDAPQVVQEMHPTRSTDSLVTRVTTAAAASPPHQPAAAAALHQEDDGLNRYDDRCEVCGLDPLPAKAATRGHKVGDRWVGWRCRDTEACQARVDARATAEAQAQRERDERKQREDEAYNAPEAVAKRAAQAAEVQARREAEERQRILAGDPIAALAVITNADEMHTFVEELDMTKLRAVGEHLGVELPPKTRMSVWADAIEAAWIGAQPPPW